MQLKSKKTYKSLRNSDFIKLQSERTLRRHNVGFGKQGGFTDDTIKEILKETDVVVNNRFEVAPQEIIAGG